MSIVYFLRTCSVRYVENLSFIFMVSLYVFVQNLRIDDSRVFQVNQRMSFLRKLPQRNLSHGVERNALLIADIFLFLPGQYLF